MEKTKFCSPLKIGLLIVSIAYFLFTFHVMFTLSWIGEWESLGETVGFVILVEDISANIGLIFRFAGSLIAMAGMIFYLAKRGLSTQTASKVLRVVLVAEAIYWLPLFVSGALPLFYMNAFGNRSLMAVLSSLITNEIPALVESTAIPIALFMLAYKLKPKKPLKGAIKWSLIVGTVYIFVFWLVYMSIWIVTIWQKGTGYLTSYPENLLSFVLTTFGLLALAIFSAYFTKKSNGAETFDALNNKIIGGIILALGMYFLWNYLTWIFFGRNALWSAWYAWFLGHNMDLWLLSIPLVGVPLILAHKSSKTPKTEELKPKKPSTKKQ